MLLFSRMQFSLWSCCNAMNSPDHITFRRRPSWARPGRPPATRICPIDAKSPERHFALVALGRGYPTPEIRAWNTCNTLEHPWNTAEVGAVPAVAAREHRLSRAHLLRRPGRDLLMRLPNGPIPVHTRQTRVCLVWPVLPHHGGQLPHHA